MFRRIFTLLFPTQMAVRKLTREVSYLQRVRDDRDALLCNLEWSATSIDGLRQCPVCYALASQRPNEHDYRYPSCALARIIDEASERAVLGTN